MKKKIILLIYLSMIISCLVNGQTSLVIQFTQNNVPTYVLSSGTYSITTSDAGLNTRIAGYTITQFEKKFPTVYLETHPLAAKLDRVFTVNTSGNITQLYNDLVNYGSPIVSELYLSQDPLILMTPNDYALSNYLFCNGSTNSGAALDLINAKEAWDVTQGNPNLIIGITDFAMDNTHEDLVNKILPSTYTSVYGGGAFYHGTQVAAVAACETNNNKGLASIGNQVKLKYFNGGNINNILVAAQSPNNCKVINCSWLSSCNYIQSDQDLITLVHDTYKAVITAGAGNGLAGTHCGTDGNGALYPAAYNYVLSISSVGHLFNRDTYFSCLTPAFPNYQTTGFGWKDVHDAYSNMQEKNPALSQYTFTHNTSVDLCAPGYAVRGIKPGNLYDENLYGTSFSAPMVAGTAALILSVNSNFSPEDVEAILKCSARDLYEVPENYAYLNLLGAGRIDAGKALKLAQTWTPNTGYNPQAAPTDIRWFDILSDNGTSTVEEETTCLPVVNTGKKNVGYRLQATGTAQNYKWLIYYLENGLPVTYSVKYGSSVMITRGVDYPRTNSGTGTISVSVRAEGCAASIYYREDRGASCIDPNWTVPCLADVTITGTYSVPITESSTYIKSSGQTTILSTASVKLDADPVNGRIELIPATASDFFLAAPSTTIGVFAAQALDGCGIKTVARVKKPAAVTTNTAENDNSPVSVHPNPASNIAYVVVDKTVKGPVTILITDMNGKVVSRSSSFIVDETRNQFPVRTDKLNSGIYIVSAITKKYSATCKLIISK